MPARREAVLAEVERTLADIRRLGDALATAGPREDTGLVGLSLQLAARAPADSFVFMVGDRPVIVCWGYEKEAAAGLLPAALPQPPLPGPAAHRAVLEAPIPAAVPMLRPPPGTTIPWARTLLAALPLLLLLLGSAWLLRGCLPADPALSLATREGPDAPPAPEPAPDPKPALKASFSNEESRGRMLKTELALIEAELKKRIADCKPPEAPKPPPQVALAPPPPPQPAQARARPGAAAAACPARRRSPAPAVGAHQRLLLHAGLLAHRSVPPRDRSSRSPASRPIASTPTATASSNGGAAAPPAAPARSRASTAAGSCACATPTRPATTARTGTPTSWSAGAAPTTWRNAAARRAARSVPSPGRSTCTS